MAKYTKGNASKLSLFQGFRGKLTLSVSSMISCQSTGNQSKSRQEGLYQTKKFLHRKGNNKIKRQPVEWNAIKLQPMHLLKG